MLRKAKTQLKLNSKRNEVTKSSRKTKGESVKEAEGYNDKRQEPRDLRQIR